MPPRILIFSFSFNALVIAPCSSLGLLFYFRYSCMAAACLALPSPLSSFFPSHALSTLSLLSLHHAAHCTRCLAHAESRRAAASKALWARAARNRHQAAAPRRREQMCREVRELPLVSIAPLACSSSFFSLHLRHDYLCSRTSDIFLISLHPRGSPCCS